MATRDTTDDVATLEEKTRSARGADTISAPPSIPSSATAAETTDDRRPSANEFDYPALVPVDPEHYIVDKEIARGGMGRILVARDRRLGRTVALKELLAPTEEHRVRFEREARITARLQHPGIVNILEAGAWPSSEPFFAMKLVEGESLDKVIAKATTLEQRLALLPNVIAVADALAYAHGKRVIHRDLKPGNVLVGAYGETVVIDWGLAKDLSQSMVDAPPSEQSTSSDDGATVAGSVIGTPAYMPPEQALGEPVDERADVYAIGCILYHTLCGQPPFRGSTGADVLAKVVTERPLALALRAPGLPPDLVAIVEKAMALTPANRYPTANELAIDLKKFQTGQLVGVHRYSAWQLLRRWIRRNRTAVLVGSIAAVALVVLGVTSIVGVMREQARTEAQRVIAERSRRAAEDLLSFMLGDLKDKLEPVGKLPLLDSVARKALAYYAERPDSSDPKELHDRATALASIGEVLLKQGAFEDADRQLDAAMALRRRLAKRVPDDLANGRGIASVHLNLSKLRRKQGKDAEAEREVLAMKQELERLLERHASPDDQAQLAYAYEMLGRIERERGNLDTALVQLRRALELRTALGSAKLQWRLDVSSSHEAIGAIYEVRGELAAALAEYRTAAAIREQLLQREPENTKLQFALALARDHIGTLLSVMGDSKGALEAFQSELRLAQRLVARDETNTEWRDLLAMTKSHIGDSLHDRGDLAGALDAFRESEAILLELAKRDPSNLHVQHHLAMLHDKVGLQLKRMKRLDGALASFAAGKAIRERRSKLDPNNVAWQRELVISLDAIAEVQLEKGQLEEALATFRENLVRATAIAAIDPSNVDWQRDLALSHQNVTNVLMKQGRSTEALVELRAAVAIFEALVGKEPTSSQARRDLGIAYIELGDAHAATKQPREALAAHERARAILAELVANDPTNVNRKIDLGDALAGIVDAAQALGDRELQRATLQSAIANARLILRARPDDAVQRDLLRGFEGKLAKLR